MTGRELIIYILQNGLEDEQVLKTGKILGFINIEEAAAKFNVGVGTVYAWILLGQLTAVEFGGPDNFYIPANAEISILPKAIM